MKKLILLGLVFVLLASCVSGLEITNGNTLYWNLDSGISDSTPNGNNGTLVSTPTQTVGGKINGGYNFTDNAQSIKPPSSLTNGPSTDISLTMWFKPDSISAVNYLFAYKGMATRYSSSSLLWFANISDTSVSFSNTFNTEQWYFLTITQSGTTYHLYLNSVEKATGTTVVLNLNDVGFPDAGLGYLAGSSGHKGAIDEFGMWDRELNQTEIDYLYASGSPTENQQYPFTSNTAPTTPTDITFNPTTVYSNTNFSVNASGSTDPDNDTFEYYYQFYDINDTSILKAYSTDNDLQLTSTQAHHIIQVSAKAIDNNSNNGSVYSENITVTNTAPTIPTTLTITGDLYAGKTITATGSGSTDSIDNDALTYYYEFYDINDSSTLQAYSTTNTYAITNASTHHNIRVRTKAYDGYDYSSELETIKRVEGIYVTLTLNDFYNSSSINNFTILFSNSTQKNTLTGTLNFYTDILSDTYTLYSANYFNLTNTTNFNITMDFNLYPYTKIYVTDFLTSENIQTYTLNSTNYGEFNTTVGLIYYPLYNLTDEVLLKNATNGTTDYEWVTINLTGSPYLENYTFTLKEYKVFTFNFYDEQTRLALNNVTIDISILGDSFINYTNIELINQSEYNISLLVPDYYRINYIPTGYKENNYYALVTTGSFSNLSLYALKENTDPSLLVLNVIESTDFTKYSGLIVAMQRLYIGDGLWATVQMQETGEFGEAFFNIEEIDTDYRFIFKTKDNTILKTSAKYVFSCTAGVCESTSSVSNATASTISTELTIVSSNTNSENATINWSDPLGENHNVLINVNKISNTGSINICTESQIGSSGTVNCNLSGVSGEIQVIAYIDGDINSGIWKKITTPILPSILGEAEGAFWILGIGLTISMMGLFSGVGAIIFTIVGLIIAFLLGLSSALDMTLIMISGVIGIIIATRLKK